MFTNPLILPNCDVFYFDIYESFASSIKKKFMDKK